MSENRWWRGLPDQPNEDVVLSDEVLRRAFEHLANPPPLPPYREWQCIVCGWRCNNHESILPPVAVLRPTPDGDEEICGMCRGYDFEKKQVCGALDSYVEITITKLQQPEGHAAAWIVRL
jgi:hypothetical protein